jgi:hypothetical protein
MLALRIVVLSLLSVAIAAAQRQQKIVLPEDVHDVLSNRPAAEPIPADVKPLPGDARPSGKLDAYRGKAFSFTFPANWQIRDTNGEISVVPKAARKGEAISLGIIAGMEYNTVRSPGLSDGNGTVVGRVLTNNLKRQMRQNSPSILVDVGRFDGMLTWFAQPSVMLGGREINAVLTVQHPDRGFLYMIFICPEGEWDAMLPHFLGAIDSLKF